MKVLICNMLTSYNVISSDGFIAQTDGSEDFIPDEVWGDFLEFLGEYDALLIGKKHTNLYKILIKNSWSHLRMWI